MAESINKREVHLMARKLDGKKVAILVADGFEQVEMTKPREALDEAAAQTKIVSLKPGKIQGMNHADKGDKFDVDLAVKDARPNDFDALMIPGGLFQSGCAPFRSKRASVCAAFFPGAQTGSGHMSWTAGLDQRGSCSRRKDDFVASNSGRYAQRRRKVGR
jgi:protease I